MRLVHIDLPDGLEEVLDYVTKFTGRSRASHINEAIEDYITDNKTRLHLSEHIRLHMPEEQVDELAEKLDVQA